MEPKVWLPNPSSLPPHTPPQFSFAAYPLVAWSCSKYPSLGLTCTACTQCLPAHLYPQVPEPNGFLIPGTTNNIISHLDACTHCFSSSTCECGGVGVLEIKPRALGMVDKGSSTEPCFLPSMLDSGLSVAL